MAATPEALRQRQRREREARGLIVLSVEVDEFALAEVLLSRGMKAMTRSQLSSGAAHLISEAVANPVTRNVTRDWQSEPERINVSKTEDEAHARTTPGTSPAV